MNFLFLKTLKLLKGSLYPIFARNVSQKPTLTPKELVSEPRGRGGPWRERETRATGRRPLSSPRPIFFFTPSLCASLALHVRLKKTRN